MYNFSFQCAEYFFCNCENGFTKSRDQIIFIYLEWRKVSPATPVEQIIKFVSRDKINIYIKSKIQWKGFLIVSKCSEILILGFRQQFRYLKVKIYRLLEKLNFENVHDIIWQNHQGKNDTVYLGIIPFTST